MFNNRHYLSKNTKAMVDNPVPNRMAPRQLPGVYIIICLANNKSYYGESSNISARLSQHKSRLRRNIHEIRELQRDWNCYGEDFFEFSALFMSRDCDKAQRQNLEFEYMAYFFDHCYNKFNKTSRKKQNNPFLGQKHSELSKTQISKSLIEHYKKRLPEGLPIMLKGKVYPSISEASRETKHSRDTIRRWLNDPSNNHCQLIDMCSQPQYLLKQTPKVKFAIKKTQQLNTGLAKPVSLDGVIYPSIAEAARNLKCSRANIQRRLKTQKESCFFIISM